MGSMSRPGSYKISRRAAPLPTVLDPLGRGQRIVESLRSEILGGLEGAEPRLSIRQVFRTPREIFRVELEVPELSYQRTTLLDRDALEDLLESREVRDLLAAPID